MKVYELRRLLEDVDSEADVYVTLFLGSDELDVEVDSVEELSTGVFINTEKLHIVGEK